MPLSKEQNDLILDALNKKDAGGVVCPVSHDKNWGVEPNYVMHASQGDPKQQLTVLGGRGYPYAILTCKTCGYTMFFNLMVLGSGSLAEQLGFLQKTPAEDEAED